MNVLFESEKPRRKNGQFATKEVAYVDRIAEENKVLRFEKEKYLRAYLSLEKENRKLKDMISKIKMMLI